jgi:mono/diheme cytochrome c family protein
MNKLNMIILLAALQSVQILTAAQAEGVAAAAGNAVRGKQLWTQQFEVSGQLRSCSSCHGVNPGAAGKHVRTGKLIEPMAPAANPQRLTDAGKVEKWFKRNCKWTMGRECSAEEKSDFIAYLKHPEVH